jgi:hypothetical protein
MGARYRALLRKRLHQPPSWHVSGNLSSHATLSAAHYQHNFNLFLI